MTQTREILYEAVINVHICLSLARSLAISRLTVSVTPPLSRVLLFEPELVRRDEAINSAFAASKPHQRIYAGRPQICVFIVLQTCHKSACPVDKAVFLTDS